MFPESFSQPLFLFATAVFSITGVLAAARQNMDVLGLVIIGMVTAIGGGTLRDVMLDVPVFWLADPTYTIVAAIAAALTFFFERRFRATEQALLYLDGIATALFAVIATAKTQALGFSPVVALTMGAITGVGGGLIRDLLTGHPTILLRRELYITPLLLGGALFLALDHFTSASANLAMNLGMLCAAGIRLAAVRFHWQFPDELTYRAPR